MTMPSEADLTAAAIVTGNVPMPDHLPSKGLYGTARADVCTWCGPFSPSMSWMDHLRQEHDFRIDDWMRQMRMTLR